MTAKKKSSRELSVGWSVILSAINWFVGIAATMICVGIGLLMYPFDLIFFPDKRLVMHTWARYWGKMIIAGSPVCDLKLMPGHDLDRSKTYVVIANHQSIMDILVVLAGLRLNFKFLSKEEVFSVPGIGGHMKRARYISLKRNSPESAKAAILSAKTWLMKKVSVVFFPEGTRSADGQIHAFKPGAFRLAQELGLPVLPLVIDGTGDAIPKKSWRLRHRSSFFLSILEPVMISKEEDLAAAMQKIHDRMARRLAEMRVERGE